MGGAVARGEQVAALAVIRHGMMTDHTLSDLLNEANAQGGLDAWQVANLREMRRKWIHATAIPADLVEAMSKASNACETIWRTARRDADFGSVLPAFEEVLTLTKRLGEAKAAVVKNAIESKPHVLHPSTALQKLPNAVFFITTGAAKLLEERNDRELQAKV